MTLTSQGRADSSPFDLIDAIRALAASAVVWDHVWNLLAASSSLAMTPAAHLLLISAGFGQDAVFVLFIISGYWNAKSVDGRVRRGAWRWREYAVDRVTRLWIVLIPALLVGGLCDIAGRFILDLPLYQAMPIAGAPSLDIGSRLDVSHLLATLFFLQEAILPPFGSNGPLWSLAYEF